MIHITMLGTSALMPIPERALTSALLQYNGHSILFDCGEGTQTAARKAHVSLMKTDIIALTHYHGDHIFGLPGLLQTMSMMGRTEPLHIIAPNNAEESLAPILHITGHVSFEIRFPHMPEDGLPLDSIHSGWGSEARLCAFQTEHRVPSLGYCFTLSRCGKFMPERAKALGIPVRQWGILQKGQSVVADGRTILPNQVLGEPRKGLKVVFSGDTSACASLEHAAHAADLLISEATYGENEQSELAVSHGHMNFAHAARIAKTAEVRRLWLTHFSQMMENPQEYLPNATDIFADAVCCEDGMNIDLDFEES